MADLGYSEGDIWYAGSANKHLLNIIDSGTTTITTSGGTFLKYSGNASGLMLTINGPIQILGCWTSGTCSDPSAASPQLKVIGDGNTFYLQNPFGLATNNTTFEKYVCLGNRYVGGSITFWGGFGGTNGSMSVIAEYI